MGPPLLSSAVVRVAPRPSDQRESLRVAGAAVSVAPRVVAGRLPLIRRGALAPPTAPRSAPSAESVDRTSVAPSGAIDLSLPPAQHAARVAAASAEAGGVGSAALLPSNAPLGLLGLSSAKNV